MRTLRTLAALLMTFTTGISSACAQAETPPPPREREREQDPQERIRRLENQARELKEAIDAKGGSPEERKEWAAMLQVVRGQLDDARGWKKSQEPPHQKELNDRLMARLREIEVQMKQRVGPEDQKELAREAEKIREALKRGETPYGIKGGPPMDPETLKLHMQIKELEGHAHGIGMKLRSVPAENKEDRAVLQDKLKEAVTQLFDLRETVRAKEVEHLKKRLEELTGLLEKRKANRDQIIERRIRQLSGELDELDW